MDIYRDPERAILDGSFLEMSEKLRAEIARLEKQIPRNAAEFKAREDKIKALLSEISKFGARK